MFQLNPIKFDSQGWLENEQISLFNIRYNANDIVLKRMLNGFAGIIRFFIMPKINEEPYAVLYKGEGFSRPNYPVNVLIGALILKELMNISSDEELADRVNSDRAFQLALCLDNSDRVMSASTIQLFRTRTCRHYLETGENLLYNTFRDITDVVCEIMEIDKSSLTMDSTDISMWYRHYGRLMMLYLNNRIMIEKITNYKIFKRPVKTCDIVPDITVDSFMFYDTYVDREEEAEKVKSRKEAREEALGAAREILPDKLHHYLDVSDKNTVNYHSDLSKKERIRLAIEEAVMIKEFCEENTEYMQLPQYTTFVRVFTEQCKKSWDENGNCVWELKKAGDGMNSNMVQSLFDTIATFREKDGEVQFGYAMGFLKAMNADGDSVVLDHNIATNNTSDKDLGVKLMENMPFMPDGAIVAADSLFVNDEVIKAAESKNIQIVGTNLTGKKPPIFMAEHEFDEKGLLTKCAGGAVPLTAKLQANGSCRVTIEKSACENCPHKAECQYNEQSKTNSLTVSVKTTERAMALAYRDTPEFEEIAHIRNGVETIPSIFKNHYDIENTRGKGIEPRGIRASLVSMAYNIKNFVNFLIRQKIQFAC